MDPTTPPSDTRGTSPEQGWRGRNGRWELRWNGRAIAIVQPDHWGAAVTLDCRKMWQNRKVRVANANQGVRFAKRWCAVRLFPGLRLRDAVQRLVGAATKDSACRAEQHEGRSLAVPLEGSTSRSP